MPEPGRDGICRFSCLLLPREALCRPQLRAVPQCPHQVGPKSQLSLAVPVPSRAGLVVHLLTLFSMARRLLWVLSWGPQFPCCPGSLSPGSADRALSLQHLPRDRLCERTLGPTHRVLPGCGLSLPPEHWSLWPCEHRAGTWGVCPRWEVWPSTTEMPAAAAFPPPTHAFPTGSNSRLGSAAGSPVYLDLAYLPGGGAGHLDQDFFLRVRALCYVISGQGQRQEEGLRAVLDALLAGKQRWDLDLQVGGPRGPGAPVHGAEMLCPPQDSSGDRWCPAAEKCHQRGGCFPDLWGRDLEAEAVLTPHAEQMARPPCVCTVGFGDVGHRPHGRVQRRPQPKGSVAL